ncbi:MAG: hypothetical protein A3I26_00690 [Candidatus Yanofskybacteria bacterium RIFCSPLOWO2_02_FULL_43_10]|uniref:Uncharacterized protein n=1 Tax=Candidatus Yanofskybacteria bacterium RIFCSPLOWO2_12_FULL_43_11b TaxID=1802710 RepID=A0A1F8H718_9BACT|nr:MAG: hypothetical protein A2742_03905 [Candidatus Yanofskybacteria bacterium RIFCSPHIGHO2_01_FULL_43_32]OGN10943.1 MAG: hypothetical protein A3C69_03115 [Candidatus Yanofskybacteria bacterium RIFCSPHIGHO2_02_FULL_43_12]OGN17092.1 MAG: hypothetical protein A3E34_03425 [Candidatus Yanofskybacteria bacterium RIFCSPHIGHO2_12_FULL_43_11]OGN24426.1 MAG: hypothetical protein A2923_00890 [Candidatus Yanofskybacteria bacterium RIFCSPLOWO2_01_FULL_43_46]OGN28491.1 MAG: hypothetical protein A3I26_00690
MSNLLKGNRVGLIKTAAVLTAAATVLSLSGVLSLTAFAVAPSDYGLKEGDTISAAGSDDPDVYIVNDWGYKRLFLNPQIFNLYGHLGGFSAVKNVSPATRDAFGTSGLFRVDGTEKVYGIESTGEDTSVLHWVNTSGAQAVADDANFFKKVFVINQAEFNLYTLGSNYTSVNQVPSYSRVPGTTPTPTGPLSVSLAPGNPAAQTITNNAVGVEMLRVRVSGSGTVNTMTVKRLGAGTTGDFGDVYVYDGATRLVSGKSLSTSSGEATFLLNVAVNGTKDLSVVADMSTGGAGNVNYFSLTGVTAAGGSTVGGVPINGNNFAISGASSGGVTVTRSGSLFNPTVGQKGALLSEFKLTANTEAASVKRLTMINDGTVKYSDITNLKLKTNVGSSEWSGTMTSGGYAVFDLGSGYNIAKGGNAIFSVYGDVAGKKDETINLFFEYSTDILAIGDQYGQGMAITNSELDETTDRTDLTLQGGALTLVFNGPSATTVGTQATDVTLLRYAMTAAANIEVKKTEFTLCVDTTGNGAFDTASDESLWDDLTDFKVWNEDTNTVIMGPKDGTAFDDVDDSGSCPDSVAGAQETFTDTFDLFAGQTLNLKVTADFDTSLDGTLTQSGSIVKVVLDDYSDDAGVTVMKYSGTNTAVAAADIVPRADISGANITLTSSALTLSLAGNPSDQTKIRGTQDIDAVGITFAAGQASALNVTTIKLTGYASDEVAGTFVAGVDGNGNDSGTSVANAISNVELYEATTGILIAGANKVTNNSLGTADTGTMTFGNLNWNIPAGTSKTMLVRVDLSNNTASGTAGDGYAFDIAAVGDVTSLDSDSNTVNAGNAKVNGTAAAPTNVLTVKNSGSMTIATSADSPSKGAIYWGQQNAPISKFRLSATDEGQYIEKLTFMAPPAADEANDAAANVNEVVLTYKNKAGSPLTTTQSFGSAASVNFNWSGTDVNRPYVPQDSSLDIAVNANMKTKAQGATQDAASAVFFSLDLDDKYNGSTANGFRAVGEGSGTVLDGASTNIDETAGANNQYVYRVFPKLEVVSVPTPYSLSGTPTVFKFSVTAMGLADSNLRFDNVAAGSGSIKFEILSSGNAGGDSSVTTYDDSNSEIIDTATLTDDGNSSGDASYSMDFSSKIIEIQGGSTKTFRIQLNGTSVYDEPAGNGEAGDYFQVVLRDTTADDTALVNWVGNYAGADTAADTASTAGVLRSVPLFGPNFTR